MSYGKIRPIALERDVVTEMDFGKSQLVNQVSSIQTINAAFLFMDMPDLLNISSVFCFKCHCLIEIYRVKLNFIQPTLYPVIISLIFIGLFCV